MGISECLLLINYEPKSDHNMSYCLLDLIMQNIFSSPDVLIISSVETVWVISFRQYVLQGAHVELPLYSETIVRLHCVRDGTSSVQLQGFFQFNILFLLEYFTLCMSAETNR